MHKIFLGTVVKGLGKGKTIGFPTANIKLINNELHIDSGVHAVNTTIDNQNYKGMLYVGTRPTLNMLEQTIEIHIFEFDKNIYDMQISFQILHKIRDEIKFKSEKELIEQLHRDRETVKSINN